jgi:hypothetical protein
LPSTPLSSKSDAFRPKSQIPFLVVTIASVPCYWPLDLSLARQPLTAL